MNDQEKKKKEKRVTSVLMAFLVIAWGLDYVFAKNALHTLEPLALLFYKYAFAAVLVFTIKLARDGGKFFIKRDVPLFIICALLGELAYFYCEYTAMDYMPVSLISIIVSFVPILSIITERVLYKRKTSGKVTIGIGFCILGVVLIIGVDMEMLFQGRIFGYLLAFTCVFSWNAYNFITASLHKRYTSVTLTANQLVCTLLILLPYVIHSTPSPMTFLPGLFWELLYLGVISSGIGFLIQVRSLHVLGPTTTALFSNFLPVTATFFGWLFLKETIAPVQILGGVLVISAGYVVIKENGKVEEATSERETELDNADGFL